ncbi:uncharacterized protein MYCFIDRAFT_210049 [Pseudocercospora fijiensis CIRAD86]|uniref:Uncharacterized protein n=1 Tax=Pseudocercospora fijiensis (strain CIRAD86) TaxID=383855 RepID=N1QB83_PSEFD|nr:uncharacterized protein MYCFIDRAFT_210049 [Pseudocercospora fijiensis CIRAD86]EME89301.1 hypothetical protein MYCFIDRAFT_210049 [Pseudocercospora fijiensis CIRAD86]
MSSKRHSVRPVVVHVQPDNIPTPSSPPSATTTAKTVRFAPSSNNGSSRPLTSIEAWSLYHFEIHARQCRDCYDPYDVYKKRRSLCEVGHGLASDVACHVYYQSGDIYSCSKGDSELVRVEIPHGYDHTRLLLKAFDRKLRSHRNSAPLVHSYDRSYPVSARRYYPDGGKEDVLIEPASSKPERKSSDRKSRHKPLRYSTVVLQDDDTELVSGTKTSERRGSLYEKDAQRKKQDYRVEIREPSTSERQRRRDDGRRNSVWL